MNLVERVRYKFLQASYRPHKPKARGGAAKGFLNDIEEYLTPESEKKKKKEKSDKVAADKD